MDEVVREQVASRRIQTRVFIRRVVGRPALDLHARIVGIAVIDDIVAEDAVEEYRHIEILVAERQVETGRKIGVRVADDAAVPVVDGVIAVQVHVFEFTGQVLAVGTHKTGVLALLDDAVDPVAVEDVHRITDGVDARIAVEHRQRLAADLVLHTREVIGAQAARNGVAQVGHLVAVAREDECRGERGVLPADDVAVERELESAVADIAVVDPHLVITARQRQVLLAQQVGGVLVVVIHRQAQAALEEGQVDAQVPLTGRFPPQIGVGNASPEDIAVVGPFAAGLITRADGCLPLVREPVFLGPVTVERLVRRNALVAREAPARTDLELVESIEFLHPRLVVEFPAHGARREIAPLAVLAEFRRSVGAHGERKEVLVVEHVVQAAVEREQLAVLIGVVDHVLLGIARTHVLVAEGVVHKIVGRGAERAPHVVVVRMARHDRQVVPVGEGPLESDVGFAQHILRQGVVHLCDTVHIVRFLRGVRSVVNILQGGRIAVIELCADFQPFDDLPLGGQRRNEVAALRLVLDVVGDDERMAEVGLRSDEIIAFLVVDGPQRITAVFERVVHVPLVDRKDVRSLERKVFSQFVRTVERDVAFAEVVLFVDAFVIVIIQAQVDRRLIGGMRQRGRRVVDHGRAHAEVGPIGIRPFALLDFDERRIVGSVVVLARIEGRQSGVGQFLVGDLRHLQRIAPDVEFVGELPDRGPVIHRDVGLPALGGAGLDQDHAVGAAGTVNSRRGGVFQYLDRLDVRRVDLRQVAGIADGESVDHDQRSVRTVERAVTADAHDGSRTRVLRRVHDLQSRSAALQQSLHRRSRNILDGVHLHGNDRSGQVALLHAAVADNDHVVDQGLFGLEHDVEESRPGRNGDLAGLVTDKSHGKHGPGLGAEREITRGIGTGSGRRSLDDDAGSDERLSVGRHPAPDPILGRCADCKEQGGKKRQEPPAPPASIYCIHGV